MVGYEGKRFIVKDISGSANETTNLITFQLGTGTTIAYAHTIDAPYGDVVWYLDGTVWRNE